MSEKAKARDHKPTTAGRKSLTNGEINVMVSEDKFEYYLSKGYYFGKSIKNKHTAWNKGLNKSDPRVKKYTESRNKTIKENPERYSHCGGVKKGNIPWNKGLKGWNYGHVVSEETRKKISERTKGVKKKRVNK